MIRGARRWMMVMGLAGAGILGGCQNAPAAAGDAGGTTPPAEAGKLVSAKAPASQTWYTHEGAEMLYRQAKYADAENMCKQAIDQIEKNAGGNASKSPELAPPLIDLATVYMRLARFDDARRVIDRAESVLDPAKPDQAILLGRLGINKGWRLYTLGELAGATKVFEDARALIEKNQQGDSVDLAELINNIGLMYEEMGEKQDDPEASAELIGRARRLLLQGWMMRRKLTGDESPETAESLNNLGMHLTFNGDSPEDIELGIETLRKSVDLAQRVYGKNHPETAMAHAVLAMVLMLQHEDQEAEKEVRIAMPVTEQFLGSMHPDRAFELMTLGRIAQRQQRYDAAEKDFLEALAIDEHVYGKTHPNLIGTLEAIKSLYDQSGDSVKGRDIEKRIEKLSGKEM